MSEGEITISKTSIGTITAVTATVISVSTLIWGAAVLSNQVAQTREDVAVIQKEMAVERERRDARTAQLATIEANYALIMAERKR